MQSPVRLPFKRVFLPCITLLLVLTALAFSAKGSNAAQSTPTENTFGSPRFEAASSAPAVSATGEVQAIDPNGIQRLKDATGGTATIKLHPATGAVRFLSLKAGSLSLAGETVEAQATAFFDAYGNAFGIRSAAAELQLVKSETDALGMTHLSYAQRYRGIPVFAGTLRLHFNAAKQLTAVNGTFVPAINVSTEATLDGARAAELAIADVAANPPAHDHDEGEDGTKAVERAAPLPVSAFKAPENTLSFYHTGVGAGTAGTVHLVYKVEVTNGTNIRDFVFVDAHSGAIVERMSTIHDALNRRVYEGSLTPANLVWQEGDPFPGTLNVDQQNIVLGSGDSYYLFFNAFGRDSYNGAGAAMETVNNDPTISCPNANWNGTSTNYCNGVTSDDVVAHEWGHAVTEYTSNLIYAWQPGALNESYSDIWGETVDLLNARQTDSPATTRSPNVCTNYTAPRQMLVINSPAAIAGTYNAGTAAFGPALTSTGITGNVVQAVDGTGTTTDGCEALTNAASVAGNIALIDRGNCNFTIKVKNAQNAGAIAAIIVNNVTGTPGGMPGTDATITIPSVLVAQATGNAIKAQLGTGVNVTMRINNSATEDTYRWLIGEDSTAFGGAIRDMWAPTCEGHADRTQNTSYYHCATTDSGGVHLNSGVPNHGYALLVDGGTFNGQTITGLGLVKAAHIYWRANAVYQVQDSDFADHASALRQACSDLATAGTNLQGLSVTSTPAGPSGQIVTVADCVEVDQMIAAVELEAPVTAQCNFQPLLAKTPPALCEGVTGASPVTVMMENFTSGLGSWTLTNQGVFGGWDGRNWELDATLPGGRTGQAALAPNTNVGNCDGGAGDGSGSRSMTSSVINIPAGTSNPRLAFQHYVTTESGWDGGNLKISINGGAFTVVPNSAYLYNGNNATLQTAVAGNTNPLAGQPGFTGTDGGQVGGSWGQSQINLAALGVVAGNTVQLRYDFGQDGCTGIDGWYVDDVEVYTCAAPTANTIADIEVVAGPERRIVPLGLLVAGIVTTLVSAWAVARRRTT